MKGELCGNDHVGRGEGEFFCGGSIVFLSIHNEFSNNGRIKGLRSRAQTGKVSTFCPLNVKELWYQGELCMREKDEKIWSKITIGAMGFFNGVTPVITAMQQTFAFLLKVLFDFFEKSV